MDAEAKSNPMEGNTQRNVELGLQNLQFSIHFNKYTKNNSVNAQSV